MTPARKSRIISVLDHRQQDITVVLENVFDPHNISAVLRSCDAVGIQDIYVLNSRIAPHRRWGHKSSSSASDWVTVHQFTEEATCFTALREKYGRIFSTRLTGAISLQEMDFTIPVALVFGNEHEGVSGEADQLSDGHFFIPQVGMIRSLNISVACAVTLYEAFRQKSIAGHYQRRQLEEGRYQSLFRKWGREHSGEITEREK